MFDIDISIGVNTRLCVTKTLTAGSYQLSDHWSVVNLMVSDVILGFWGQERSAGEKTQRVCHMYTWYDQALFMHC